MGQRLRSDVVLKYQQVVMQRTHRKQQWRPCWRFVPEKHRCLLVEVWVSLKKAGNDCPKVMLDWYRKGTLEEEELKENLPHVCRMQSKQIFLTYNGPWGIVPVGSELPPTRRWTIARSSRVTTLSLSPRGPVLATK